MEFDNPPAILSRPSPQSTDQMDTFHHIKELTRQRLHSNVDHLVENVFYTAMHQHKIASATQDECPSLADFMTQIGESLQVSQRPLANSLYSTPKRELVHNQHFYNVTVKSEESDNDSEDCESDCSECTDRDCTSFDGDHSDSEDDGQFLEEVVTLNKRQKISMADTSKGLTEPLLNNYECFDNQLANVSIQTVEFDEAKDYNFGIDKNNDKVEENNVESTFIPTTLTHTTNNKRKSISVLESSLPKRIEKSFDNIVKQKPKAQTEPPEESVYNVQGFYCPFNNCKLANQIFSNAEYLHQHLADQHRSSSQKCRLQGCGIAFADRSKLDDHLNERHWNVTKWKCAFCSFLPFRTHTQLERHHSLNHERGAFVCTLPSCGFVSDFRFVAIKHFRERHSLRFSCTFLRCFRSFRDASILQKHIQRDHLTESVKHHPNRCNFEGCSKVFLYAHHLRDHQRIHCGVRPFRCSWPECHFDAAQKSNVVSHIRMVHLHLPKHKKEQARLMNIADDREASKFVEVIRELL